MMRDAEMIARGEFFTEAELRAKPHLRRLAQPATAARTDPNSRPPSAEGRRLAASPGVCAYCGEGPDKRSALNASAMHDECQQAWDAERAARVMGNGQPADVADPACQAAGYCPPLNTCGC